MNEMHHVNNYTVIEYVDDSPYIYAHHLTMTIDIILSYPSTPGLDSIITIIRRPMFGYEKGSTELVRARHHSVEFIDMIHPKKGQIKQNTSRDR